MFFFCVIIYFVAAIAFGLTISENTTRCKNILVFDFGGGTFDVTILTIEGQDYKVLATNGDTNLGGDDFDDRMIDYFIKTFLDQSITENKCLMQELKTQCEAAKCNLSSALQTRVYLHGTNLNTLVNRACFEGLCIDLFELSIDLVKAALNDAKMTKNDIHDVVMVGGSSRIPKIQELLSKFFNGKKLCKNINSDEVVAHGAAIQAAMLQKRMRAITLVDVCPLSLGSLIKDGRVIKVVKRNTPIPTKISKEFKTIEDNQDSVSIGIFEGERVMAKDNHFLGEFVLDKIPPGPRGTFFNKIFEIDASGILTVTAELPQTGHTRKLKIINNGRLSKKEVEILVKEAADLRLEDENHKKRLKVWNDLESYSYQMRHRCENIPKPLKDKLSKEVQDLRDWLNKNKMANIVELYRKKYNFEDFLQKLNLDD